MSDVTTTYTHVTAEWIRRPLSDLGGISPADAAADPAARKRLEDLLTELAGHYVRLTNLGLPAVNPSDVRKALGMEAVPAPAAARPAPRMVRPGPIKRNALLDELGTALTGGDVDSVAFFNTSSGAVEHFMHNLGDQETARIAEAEANPELKKVTPVTTEVRYGIMSDFIAGVEDINIAGRLRTAISGKGAFRRFREAVDEEDALRRRWLAYRTKRHYHLALDWLQELGLKAERYQISPADFGWEPQPAPSAPPAPVAAEAPPVAAAPPLTAAPEPEPVEASEPIEASEPVEASEPTEAAETAPAEPG